MSHAFHLLDTGGEERPEMIFYQALRKPPEEREAFLEAECRDDARLRAEVEAMLRDHAEAGIFLNAGRPLPAALEAELALNSPEQAGGMIGPYKLRQQIGEGGFGTVWMAEQERPVRRRVALKIIKLGMDTKEVVARFEQERQALAMMDHPNIAKVLDAGATPLGRPFFVMELVRGIKITDYCNQANLPVIERLKLFIQICHAVQHAHQKGIIHRDLKPSNILVTLHDGTPVPKVIDFGVAKATDHQRLADQTVLTRFEQMIGTPAYMSPEQAEMSGLDIDTRSDIYSLGVLLYELLTGTPPFNSRELLKAGLDEMRRTIRETDPPKPSTRLSQSLIVPAITKPHPDSAILSPKSSIDPDLDWIVMKALEKDRTHRYETANGLAQDIQRHLASEPVQARPPTAGYRFRRMVRRNKAAFSAGAGIAAALLAGSAISLWQATRAGQEAERARQESQRANAAWEDLRASAPAFAAMARGLAANEKFDEAIQKLEYAIALQPDAVAYLLAKADMLQSQFRFMEAAACYRDALRLSPEGKTTEFNAALSGRLGTELAAKSSLSRESLIELFNTMTNEKRPAAEMLRTTRLLGRENEILLNHWRERLKDLPVPPDKPSGELLTVGASGGLELDLSGTRIADLSPLQGMPLHSLMLGGCTLIEDLSPLKDMPLERLYLGETELLEGRPGSSFPLRDLSPLRGLPLKELTLARTKVSSLEPLRGMPLTSLDLSWTPVIDLQPLAGMPLTKLSISGLKVHDLQPLRGMPLQWLDCSSTLAIDFSPLTGMPLETLNMAGSKARDISFLRPLPLKSLFINGCPHLEGMQVLADITTLEFLRLPTVLSEFPLEDIEAVAALQKHPNLKSVHLGSGTTGNVLSNNQCWEEIAAILRVRRALRDIADGTDMKDRIERHTDGTWSVVLERMPVTDITPLKGLPISFLNLQFTGVTDLSPLKGMPLKGLYLNCDVPDLRFLTEFKLVRLWIGGCNPGLDLSPLAGIPTLENLMLPPSPKNLEALRTLPRLKRISRVWDPQLRDVAQSAEEFWSGRLVERDPEVLARMGEYDEVEKLLRKEMLENEEANEWVAVVAVVLAQGKPELYRALAEEITTQVSRRHPTTSAVVCLLSRWSGRPAENVSEQINRSGSSDWKRVLKALQAYRSGSPADAINIASQPVSGMELPKAAMLKPILAMACHEAGKPEDASAALDDARQLISRHWPTSGMVGAWADWLIAHLLLQEAEQLIGVKVDSDTAK